MVMKNISDLPRPSVSGNKEFKGWKPIDNVKFTADRAIRSYQCAESAVNVSVFLESRTIGRNDGNLPTALGINPCEDRMEWLMVACITFLEVHGIQEHNMLGVRSVDIIVRHKAVGIKRN